MGKILTGSEGMKTNLVFPIILLKSVTEMGSLYDVSSSQNVSHIVAGLSSSQALWTVVEQNASCAEGQGDLVRFVPRRVHLISEEELFISGNGLLYR